MWNALNSQNSGPLCIQCEKTWLSLACLQTLRQLVALCSDADMLALLREAAGLVIEAPSETNTRRDAAWLAITAWNRGVHHTTMRRFADARAFMGVALALLPACPHIQQRHGEVHSCHLYRLAF